MAHGVPCLVVLLSFLACTFGDLLQDRQKRALQTSPISLKREFEFDGKNGLTKQEFIVQGSEVKVTVSLGMRAVFDYKQMTLTVKPQNETVCMVLPFSAKSVPTLEKVRSVMTQREVKFQAPTTTIEFPVQQASTVLKSALSPMSAALCGKSKIILLEPKVESKAIINPWWRWWPWHFWPRPCPWCHSYYPCFYWPWWFYFFGYTVYIFP